MTARLSFVILLLLLCTACQTGYIACPKSDRVKRGIFRKNVKMSTRTTMASIRSTPEPRRTRTVYTRPAERPPLENVDVEEWDCPKPGAKKSVPKAVKDNIRKNRKAYDEYYRNRETSDSVTSIFDRFPE